MAEPSTFIKLDRNITRWRWYKNANTFRVFVHLLIEANISDHDFEHVTIHRGEVATSYGSLAEHLELSIRSVRTSVEHLKSTGELTIKRYSKFSVFSIVNYDTYQAVPTGKLTNKRQSLDNHLTINRQQLKKVKNLKKERSDGVASSSDEWTPPEKGTPEYDAWRNQ